MRVCIRFREIYPFSHHEHKFFQGHASVRCKSCEDQRFSKQGKKSTAIKTDSAYEIAEECLLRACTCAVHFSSSLAVSDCSSVVADT